jgi:hypothetical protein
MYLQKKMVVGTLSVDEWTSDSGTPYFGIMLHLIHEKRKKHFILFNAYSNKMILLQKLWQL